MDAEFDVDNPAPDKLATAIADHKAAVATENSAYIVSRSSEYTEQIAEQDSIAVHGRWVVVAPKGAVCGSCSPSVPGSEHPWHPSWS